MKHEIETQWMGKLQFNALVNGHTVIMDAPERTGGENLGPIPKPLILTAVSGCTGMDVIAVLRSKGCHPKDFNLRVSGELSKQAPIEYVSIHIVYEVNGEPGDERSVIEAVTYSQEKICGVSRMLQRIMPVTWKVIYNGNVVFDNQPQSLMDVT